MRAVVIYESMYGNTRAIADAIASGLATTSTTEVLPIAQADAARLAAADLIIVGGPTQAWGMSRPQTRASAVAAARKQGSGLTLEPDAEGRGIREWLTTAVVSGKQIAVFATRINAPAVVTGNAARPIARRLAGKGSHLVARPESFRVTKQNTLVAGELERARRWGADLAKRLADQSSGSTTG